MAHFMLFPPTDNTGEELPTDSKNEHLVCRNLVFSIQYLYACRQWCYLSHHLYFCLLREVNQFSPRTLLAL